MAKRVINIEAGVWWSKVSVTDYQKHTPHVQQAFYFETPEHAVEDGYIRDKDRFASRLKNELTNRKIALTDRVIFSISSSKVVMREVRIPKVKDKDIEGIIKAQVREYFPMDVSSYTVTHKKLGEVDTESGKQLRIQLLAVPDNLLSNYMSFAKDNGFLIETFEYIGNSAVSLINAHFGEPAMIVQLEEQATIISVVNKNQLLFQRIAPYGYTTSLSSVLDHSVLGVKDEREAFEFLIKHDVLYGKPRAADFPNSQFTDEQMRQELLDEAYADIKETLSYHIRVVSTAFDYFRTQVDNSFTGAIYLIGDGARFAGLKQLFKTEIPLVPRELSYRALFHLAGTQAQKDAEEFGPVGLVSVIGASVAPFAIEPRELKEKADHKNNMQSAYVVLASSVVVAVVLVLTATVRYAVASSEHRRLTNRIEQLDYVQQVYDENTKAQNEAAGYFTFDESTRVENEQMGELIAQLEAQLPNDIVVDSLSVTEGSKLVLNMTSTTKLTVAQMLQNFADISFLTNFSIPSMTESEDETGAVEWNYTLNADYVPFTQPSLEEKLDAVLGRTDESADHADDTDGTADEVSAE